MMAPLRCSRALNRCICPRSISLSVRCASIHDLAGKQVVVLGLGKSGLSASKLALLRGARASSSTSVM